MTIFESENIIIAENDTIKISFPKRKFDKSFSKFLKDYPELSAEAVRLGVDAISQYKTAKNLTARFFAKTTMERKIYKDIVDILNSSGKFKMVTKKIKDGGIFYELVRT